MTHRLKISLLCSLFLAVAVILRLLASFSEFWLDEIWSWNLAQEIKSFTEILSALHHDNNHPINTAWLMLVGTNAPVWLYRLPCLLLGIFAVLIAGVRGAGQSLAQTGFVWLTLAVSFVAVEYATEARGYGYLVFATIASWKLFEQKTIFGSEIAAAVLFWFMNLLGFLAHGTFVFLWAGVMVSLVVGLFDSSRMLTKRLQRVLLWGLVPGVIFLTMLLLFYQHLERGGGDPANALGVVVQSLSLVAGDPLPGLTSLVLAGCVLIGFGFAVFFQLKQSFSMGLGNLTAIVFAPALMLLVLKPDPLYPRYFLIPILLSQLILAEYCSQFWSVKDWKRPVVLILFVGLCAGNLLGDLNLIRIGRGGYSRALQMMSNQSRQPLILIGSDHDFRNRLLLDFHHRRTAGIKPADYVLEGRWPPQGPEWVILHEVATDFVPPASLRDAAGNFYELRTVEQYYGLSGMHWAIYHNRGYP